MKSRTCAYALSIICLAISATHPLTVSAIDLSSQHFDFTIEKRSEYKYCVTFAKVKYPFSYEKRTKTDVNTPEWESMGEDRNYEYPYYPLNQATCDQLSAHQATYFGGKYMGWYKDANFQLESELTPINKWTNRFVFLLEDPIYRGPVEYSKDYRERDREIETSTLEMATFQEANVKKHTFIFTKDAKIYIRQTDSFWKLFITQSRLMAIDPSGTYLPLILPAPTCKQEAHEMSCGFPTFNRADPDLEVLPDYSDKFIKIGATSKTFISIQMRPYGAKWKEGNSRIIISPSFDAPIRPVFFEKNVLFSPHAKPNRKGNYKKADMLPYRVCVADCPEHIKLQKENTPTD